ncbi:MAG: GFA family protein [Sphingomonas sp.]|uniref:GFA family protein n=1 Tax=Sphingomonas sp. TaxID=28214 RepID=UPI001B281C08|nr:GFA family protein [Sphingomonas sp.]MBO9624019.1 GFA family protein [Sphingomonas sp.]
MADGLEGGCACGAVRYRVDREPIFVNNCHCTLCQRQTGSTSVVNMFFETEAVTQLSGETTRHMVKAGSGGDHAIVRCSACGTAMWSVYPRLGELAVGIRAGTLDDPGAVTPDAAIFTADRMPWVTLPEDIPHFEKTYVPAELLPPERFARLQALIALRAAQAA